MDETDQNNKYKGEIKNDESEIDYFTYDRSAAHGADRLPGED